MSTLIGIVTFGNLEFTKLAVKGIRETVTEPYLIYLVVGKPDDVATQAWASLNNIPHIVHDKNYGFPYSVNDIYDFAWKENSFDNLVMMGNDVIPYPYAIDSLIKVANTTDYTWICAREFDVKTLIKLYPETGQYFSSGGLNFTDFDAEPWKVPAGHLEKIDIIESPLSAVHNLALYKKSVFDTIGYIDVNFYPAYFEDQDYVRRAVNANLIPRSCTLGNVVYFHFWSRTIYQETGGSNHEFFRANSTFYRMKWGGPFGKEVFLKPFNGHDFILCPGIILKGKLGIFKRNQEKEIINYWMNR